MKSLIRQTIESLLLSEQNIHIYRAYIDNRKKGYRLKLVCDNAGTITLDKIKKLSPHITKVKYQTIKDSYYNGVCIYFDKRPKDI